jgi:hypothetical protein
MLAQTFLLSQISEVRTSPLISQLRQLSASDSFPPSESSRMLQPIAAFTAFSLFTSLLRKQRIVRRSRTPAMM